jgi:hypothetical protein
VNHGELRSSKKFGRIRAEGQRAGSPWCSGQMPATCTLTGEWM